jgi:hypothetical protein
VISTPRVSATNTSGSRSRVTRLGLQDVRGEYVIAATPTTQTSVPLHLDELDARSLLQPVTDVCEKYT